MDDFLRKASQILGISQDVLETEYCMVDIPFFIKKKQQEDTTKYLRLLKLLLASNNRSMKDDEFNNFVQTLTKNLELEDSKGEKEFDRHAFEALRFMTNQGANKTGGR